MLPGLAKSQTQFPSPLLTAAACWSGVAHQPQELCRTRKVNNIRMVAAQGCNYEITDLQEGWRLSSPGSPGQGGRSVGSAAQLNERGMAIGRPIRWLRDAVEQ